MHIQVLESMYLSPECVDIVSHVQINIFAVLFFSFINVIQSSVLLILACTTNRLLCKASELTVCAILLVLVCVLCPTIAAVIKAFKSSFLIFLLCIIRQVGFLSTFKSSFVIFLLCIIRQVGFLSTTYINVELLFIPLSFASYLNLNFSRFLKDGYRK